MGGLRGAVGRYRSRRGLTSAAQTSLKFDIQGLNDFKTGVRNLRNEISLLRGEFRSLTRDTDAWVASLGRATTAMGKMGKRGVGTGGGSGFSGGVKDGGATFSGVGVGEAVQMALPGMRGAAGAGAGAGAAGAEAAAGGMAAGAATGGLALVAQAVAGAVQSGLNMVTNRWQGLQQTGAAYDVYGSRLAVTTGVGSQTMAGRLSARPPFYGGAADNAQALTILAAQGAAYGGRGVAGASGLAGAQGVQMLQQMMPGLNSVQAAGTVTSFQSNVAQQRMGTYLFGAAARSINPATGQQKSLGDIFNGIFKAIQRNRVGRNRGKPYSREEWTAMRAPGSAVQIQLSQYMGWNDEQINDFFTYAESQAVTDPTGGRAFTGTDEQMKQVRGGERSLATEVQKTETRQGQADLQAYYRNAGSMIGQQESNRSMIDLQENTNNWLSKIYDVLSYVPGSMQGGLGGLASNLLSGNFVGAAGTAWNMIFGDVGDIGDGLSQLNPDLRGRLGAMMQANPRLQINSGFRTANAQQRLWESGNPNVAPPGKSRHTRGQAADIGPRSQMGWVQANARRFGLDTGASKGEPWHVQVAGTMIGDTTSESEAVARFRESSAAARASSLDYLAKQLVAGTTGLGGNAASGGTSSSGTGGTGPDPSSVSVGSTGGTLSGEDVAKLAYKAGFRGEDLVKFVGIAGRESHFSTGAANDTGLDNSYGLWQINTQAGNLDNINRILSELGIQGGGTRDQTKALLVKPDVNAAVAHYFFEHSGYNPWKPPATVDGQSTGQDPMWHVDLDAAKKYVETAFPQGYGDYGYGGSNGGGYASVHAPTTFNVNFAINVNGANGVDVNNLVRQIATKLEPHVRRMQAARR